MQELVPILMLDHHRRSRQCRNSPWLHPRQQRWLTHRGISNKQCSIIMRHHLHSRAKHHSRLWLHILQQIKHMLRNTIWLLYHNLLPKRQLMLLCLPLLHLLLPHLLAK